MKKLWITALTALLILSVPLTAAALEDRCTVSADTAAALAGDTVTVPVRITGNPGFTNFAAAVRYDSSALRLEKISTAGSEEEPFLCPEAAAVNLAYTAREGDAPCGYVNGASAEPVTGDGILFTVTFSVLKEVSGRETVDLELQYLRCGDAVSSAFASLTAEAADGAVEIAVKGDADADGSITAQDAALVYRHVNEALPLTQVQNLASDVNADGITDTTDAALIYRVVHQTLNDFPHEERKEETE